jgi:adenylate cyclase
VLLGWESLVPPSPAEHRVLRLIGVDRAVRLACQLKPTADISVWPLLPPEITVRDADRLNVTETGTERFVATCLLISAPRPSSSRTACPTMWSLS